jgi:DNA-binding MarR family transcriptional regulator
MQKKIHGRPARARKLSPRAPESTSARKYGGSITPIPLTVSRPELIVNGSDREFRELVHNLFGFFALHERIRVGHAKFIGLAGIEYTVLIAVGHLAIEGDVNVKTVADHLHLSGAFITTTTRRLLQLGLIHKTTDTADRRRVTLTVSGKGRAALEKLAPVQRRINDVEFGSLSRKDFLALNRLLSGMIEYGDRAVALQNYLLSGGAVGD